MQTVSEGVFLIDRARGSLQAQIREAVVSGVLSGVLVPGARLPSTRRLADYLNLWRLTVSLAYQELVAQGYLEAEWQAASEPGRPPRHAYRLTAAGVQLARQNPPLLPGSGAPRLSRRPT